jgi:hypothetical protein
LLTVSRLCLVMLCLISLAKNCFSADGSTTVPIRLRGHFPLVIVKIDGLDVPLTFDLGDSSALVLSPKILDRVKTLPTNETNRSSDVQGNIIQSAKFKLALLQIGTARFTDVIGHQDLHDPSYQATDTWQQGHFGTSLLKSYKVVLDYPHRKMTLISRDIANGQSSKCKGTIVPFLPDWNGDPVTKVSTDFGELTAVWDTGSPISILRKAGSQNIGDSVLTEAVTTKHFNLGGTDFGPLKLDVADYAEPAGTDMFVGYNFFAKHIVCIDFPGHRFLIQR